MLSVLHSPLSPSSDHPPMHSQSIHSVVAIYQYIHSLLICLLPIYLPRSIYVYIYVYMVPTRYQPPSTYMPFHPSIHPSILPFASARSLLTLLLLASILHAPAAPSMMIEMMMMYGRRGLSEFILVIIEPVIVQCSLRR